VGSKGVSLIAFQYPKPEKRDELLKKLTELAGISKGEKGCLVYEASTLADDENVIVLFERWASQEDLDLHFNGAGFQAFWSVRMTYLTKDVEIKMLSPI